MNSGTIFSLTKKRTVPKKEAQRAKLAEGTGLTEDFVCLENTIFEGQYQRKT